ncbi:hypothetical protein, conserved [Eimeria brunetti]|uniref:Uncharacterized protein n=1 Tax=Eimeria brunetti TaxID=51314 RepID=U6LEH8_9EIME|nr:hypothetical protein, conserved [Eimeria brunetti]
MAAAAGKPKKELDLWAHVTRVVEQRSQLEKQKRERNMRKTTNETQPRSNNFYLRRNKKQPEVEIKVPMSIAHTSPADATTEAEKRIKTGAGKHSEGTNEQKNDTQRGKRAEKPLEFVPLVEASPVAPPSVANQTAAEAAPAGEEMKKTVPAKSVPHVHQEQFAVAEASCEGTETENIEKEEDRKTAVVPDRDADGYSAILSAIKMQYKRIAECFNGGLCCKCGANVHQETTARACTPHCNDYNSRDGQYEAYPTDTRTGEAAATVTTAAATATTATTAAATATTATGATTAAGAPVKPHGYLGKKPFVPRYIQGADGFYYRSDRPLPPPRVIDPVTKCFVIPPDSTPEYKKSPGPLLVEEPPKESSRPALSVILAQYEAQQAQIAQRINDSGRDGSKKSKEASRAKMPGEVTRQSLPGETNTDKATAHFAAAAATTAAAANAAKIKIANLAPAVKNSESYGGLWSHVAKVVQQRHQLDQQAQERRTKMTTNKGWHNAQFRSNQSYVGPNTTQLQVKPEVPMRWEYPLVDVKAVQEDEKKAEAKEQMEETTEEKKHIDQAASPLVVPFAECSPMAPPPVANQAAVEAAQAATRPKVEATAALETTHHLHLTPAENASGKRESDQKNRSDGRKSAEKEFSAAGNTKRCLEILTAIQMHHETIIKCYNAHLCRDCQPQVCESNESGKPLPHCNPTWGNSQDETSNMYTYIIYTLKKILFLCIHSKQGTYRQPYYYRNPAWRKGLDEQQTTQSSSTSGSHYNNAIWRGGHDESSGLGTNGMTTAAAAAAATATTPATAVATVEGAEAGARIQPLGCFEKMPFVKPSIQRGEDTKGRLLSSVSLLNDARPWFYVPSSVEERQKLIHELQELVQQVQQIKQLQQQQQRQQQH